MDTGIFGARFVTTYEVFYFVVTIAPTRSEIFRKRRRCWLVQSFERILKSVTWVSIFHQSATAPSLKVFWDQSMKLPRRQFLNWALGAAALPAISRVVWQRLNG
jgi:hypothetical protein